jgi:hypothetical protein
MMAGSPARETLAHEPLRQWEKWGICVLVLSTVYFGVDTEIRSAFSNTRATDLGCFLRAGWAVRAGEDIFEVLDDNYWHYAYTPAFAVVMTPLADAPAGCPRDGMIPYPVIVAIWYLFGLFCAWLSIHWFACTLEESSSDPLLRTLPVGCRRWWSNRLVALCVCLIPIGGTLQRGQVNLMVLLMLAGMYRATVRNRRFESGLWLTAAICTKIIPAFLILFPLWRRDGRTLLGLLAGLLIALIIIPAGVWGVPDSIALHKKLVTDILLPGVLGSGNPKRDQELLQITATANHSIQAAAHNLQYSNVMPRPRWASPQTKLIHLTLSVLLTVGCLWRYGRRRCDDPLRNLLFLGCLMAVMLACSPVTHPHYFCFLVPLVMALQTIDQRQNPERSRLSLHLLVPFVLTAVIFVLTDLPIWRPREQAGLDLVSLVLLLPAAFYHLRMHGDDRSRSLQAIRAAT